MTALVLDAGALIALDRNDRAVWAMLRVAADDATTVQVLAIVTSDPDDMRHLLSMLDVTAQVVPV